MTTPEALNTRMQVRLAAQSRLGVVQRLIATSGPVTLTRIAEGHWDAWAHSVNVSAHMHYTSSVGGTDLPGDLDLLVESKQIYATKLSWPEPLRGHWIRFSVDSKTDLRSVGPPLQAWYDGGSMTAMLAAYSVEPSQVRRSATGPGWVLTGTVQANTALDALGLYPSLLASNIDGDDMGGDATIRVEVGTDYLPLRAEIRGDEVALNVPQPPGFLTMLRQRTVTVEFTDFGRPVTARLPPISARLDQAHLSAADRAIVAAS